MRRLLLSVTPVVICAGLLASGPGDSSLAAESAQDVSAEHTIWDGVFTEAQAARGMAVFRGHCAECHDDVGEAPSLAAGTFLRNWEGHSLARLYTKIHDEMPPGMVESVAPTDKLDVLAYILDQNGFPAGSEPLTRDRGALEAIQILPKGGPAPLRTGAMVQVVGCLTQGDDGSWVLSMSTEPAATALGRPGPEDQRAVPGQPLGTDIVQLQNVFPSPDAHLGGRLEVKGFLIREGSDIAVNVVTLRSLAPRCP